MAVKRDWTCARAKVDRENRCRHCGRKGVELRRMGRRLEAAHTIGREYDLPLPNGTKLVLEAAVVPLCGPVTTTATCHAKYDGHEIDLWEKLTPAERAWACKRVGPGQARRKISGRAR